MVTSASKKVNMASSNIAVFALVLLAAISLGNTESSKYAFAKVESCRGCSLNRLPEVKKFIFEDLPLYANTEFKPIPGAIPELILLNENEEEVERLQLSQLNREECNELLSSKGFTKSSKTVKDEI